MFLQADTFVIPTLKQDYPEWHLGRPWFSLWYLDIENAELTAYCEKLKQQFSQLLFQPNVRQLHITLFVCGFWQQQPHYPDDFSPVQLHLQKQRLDELQLAPFHLTVQGINSFDSALFLEVQDHTQSLHKIRQAFAAQHQEIAPLSYCPHITLGLYHQALPSQQILDLIAAIETPSFELEVKSLSFGAYQANILQGPLQVLDRYSLGH